MVISQWKGGRAMDEIRKVRFPCCVWDIRDTDRIYRNLDLVEIKSYGNKVTLRDGTLLHLDYEPDPDFLDTGGEHSLLRCRRCGALLLQLYRYDHDMYDGICSSSVYIPVKAEAEADLLNILLDGPKGTGLAPARCLVNSGWNYSWTEGSEPVPSDPEALKAKIRENYPDADRELLEELLQSAGEEHMVEKVPLPESKPEEKTEKPWDAYRYLADFESDPPTLVRLGSFAGMEADLYAYPGYWKDTPHLNDIRVGIGCHMRYDDITPEEAKKKLKKCREYYDNLSKEKGENADA